MAFERSSNRFVPVEGERPQRLKPHSLLIPSGTAKAVPLSKTELSVAGGPDLKPGYPITAQSHCAQVGIRANANLSDSSPLDSSPGRAHAHSKI
jgi:hypothetical protein